MSKYKNIWTVREGSLINEALVETINRYNYELTANPAFRSQLINALTKARYCEALTKTDRTALRVFLSGVTSKAMGSTIHDACKLILDRHRELGQLEKVIKKKVSIKPITYEVNF